MRLLRTELQAMGLVLSDIPLPHENVSRELATDLEWLTANDAVGRAALSFLEQDLTLYRRFQARISSRLAG